MLSRESARIRGFFMIIFSKLLRKLSPLFAKVNAPYCLRHYLIWFYCFLGSRYSLASMFPHSLF